MSSFLSDRCSIAPSPLAALGGLYRFGDLQTPGSSHHYFSPTCASNTACLARTYSALQFAANGPIVGPIIATTAITAGGSMLAVTNP